MKKKYTLFTCLFIFMLVLSLPLTASAASNKKKAVKAYKKFLSKSTITLTRPSKTKVNSKKIKFATAYLDGDNIPELIIDRTATLAKMPWGSPQFSPNAYAVFTYKKGKVKQIGYANSNYQVTQYYKNKGIFKQTGTTYIDEGKVQAETFYKINGNKSTNFATREGASYFLNGTSVDKNTFDAGINSYTGGASPTALKFYKNTKSNRNKKIK